MSEMTNECEVFNNLIDKLKLNTVIPQFKQATLVTQTIEENTDFSPDDGWCLYSDEYKTGTLDQDKPNLIEGEWHQDKQTITIRLLNGKKSTTVMSIDESEENHLYQDQIIIDKNKNKITIRLWWKSKDNGKYHPFAQQYMGINTSEKKS